MRCHFGIVGFSLDLVKAGWRVPELNDSPGLKIRSFFKKSVAEIAEMLDMARFLCEKSSPLRLSVSVAWHFGRAQPRR
jgi:hypothetical protein